MLLLGWLFICLTIHTWGVYATISGPPQEFRYVQRIHPSYNNLLTSLCDRILPPLNAIDLIGAEASHLQLLIQQYQRDPVRTRRAIRLSLLNDQATVVTNLAESYLAQIQKRVNLEKGGGARSGPDYLTRTFLTSLKEMKQGGNKYGDCDGTETCLDGLDRVAQKLKKCVASILLANQRERDAIGTVPIG